MSQPSGDISSTFVIDINDVFGAEAIRCPKRKTAIQASYFRQMIRLTIVVYRAGLAIIISIYLRMLLLIRRETPIYPCNLFAHLVPAKHVGIILRKRMLFLVFPLRSNM